MKTLLPITAALMGCLAWVGTASAANLAIGQASDEKKVSIAFVNDIHAQLEPHPELYWNGDQAERELRAGGLSRIATALKQLTAERPHGLLKIDGGDTFQGSGPGAWTEGEVMLRPMNALGLDMAIPGNWAVVYGADQLRHLRDSLNYPMVAANIYDQETGERTFQPTWVKEIGGVKVGVVGFTDPDVPTRQPPTMSEGLTFKAAEELQPLIDQLRSEQQVDLVVLVSHIGLHKAVPLTAKLRGVDLHLSSDTHERTYEPIEVGDTWVVEAGAFGSLVGVIDMTLRDGQIVDRQWELIELREEAFPEDVTVKRIVDEVLAPHRERMNREIGHTDVWLERYNVMTSSMDGLIANAVKEATDVDVGLSNGYRFSPPTAPGPITEADLWNWLPINLELKTGQADGQQFIDYWESEFENVFSADPERLYGGWLARPSTNVEVRFDSTAEAGKRLRSLKIDGLPVDPDQQYTLASGSQSGQPQNQIHRVKECRAIDLPGATVHDAVRSYLSQRGGVRGTGNPPVQCVVRPNVLRSQYLSFVKERPADRPVIGLQYDGPIRVVYQVSRDEWKDDVSKPLLYLKKLRGFYQKQGIEPDQLDIRAVFHGGASTHLLTDEAWNRVKQTDTGNPNTQLLGELAEMGVKIELCNSRRLQEGWSKADIHPDVLLAAAAYARLIDLQHQGYAYIRF